VPNEIMIEDMWTANCLIRPARPDVLRVVPDVPEELAEELDDEGELNDPTDEDAHRAGRGE
jgi:hypothetical protein